MRNQNEEMRGFPSWRNLLSKWLFKFLKIDSLLNIKLKRKLFNNFVTYKHSERRAAKLLKIARFDKALILWYINNRTVWNKSGFFVYLIK